MVNLYILNFKVVNSYQRSIIWEVVGYFLLYLLLVFQFLRWMEIMSTFEWQFKCFVTASSVLECAVLLNNTSFMNKKLKSSVRGHKRIIASHISSLNKKNPKWLDALWHLAPSCKNLYVDLLILVTSFFGPFFVHFSF